MPSSWPLATLRTAFPTWVKQRYPLSVKELQKVNDGSLEFWRFAWEMIESAEKARAWKRACEDGSIDPDEAARREDAEFVKSRAKVIKAARLLADDIHRHPAKTAWALTQALLKLKTQANDGSGPSFDSGAIGKVPAEPQIDLDCLPQLLSHYAESLETTPLARRGPFIHRTRHGALDYGIPLDEQSSRPQMIENSLLFELALLARQFTSRGAFFLEVGCRMPTVGQPLWSLAAAFLGDALGKHLTGHEAQDRIRKLQRRKPKLSWVGWSNPPERYFDTPPPDTWF